MTGVCLLCMWSRDEKGNLLEAVFATPQRAILLPLFDNFLFEGSANPLYFGSSF